MDRMKLDEVLKILSTLKVDREEFWVVGSTALLLRGIYPDAADIDIAVTDKGLEQIKENYNIEYKDEKWFKVFGKIEAVCDGDKSLLKYKPEKVGDYYLQNIREYYDFISHSTREKDIVRMPLIEEYMNKHNKED